MAHPAHYAGRQYTDDTPSQRTSRESPRHGNAHRMKKPRDPERELILDAIRRILAGRKPRKNRSGDTPLHIHHPEK